MFTDINWKRVEILQTLSRLFSRKNLKIDTKFSSDAIIDCKFKIRESILLLIEKIEDFHLNNHWKRAVEKQQKLSLKRKKIDDFFVHIYMLTEGAIKL